MDDDDLVTLYTNVIDPPSPQPNQGCFWQVAAILFFALLAIIL